jgi:hypothetical protein
MTPKVSIEAMPCPDLECEDGEILVYNVYSTDPLKPEKQTCDRCFGRGYVVHETIVEN